MPNLLAACIQLTSRDDLDRNLELSARMCAAAAARGANLVVLPENFAFLGNQERDKFAVAETLALGPAHAASGPIVRALGEMARQNRLWIVAGGMAETISDADPQAPARADKVYNTLVVVNPDGEIVQTYRKIHMFDVDIPGGATFKETATCLPGDTLRLVDTPFGPIGLSICYDLRFPELYRQLTAQGARILVVPAAFTQHTGKDHWHPLLRARAIENQAYVLAAGQLGRHNDKRHSYGHSLIIDPWGTIVAEAPDRECLIIGEIDFSFQDRIRRQLPCLDHKRL